MSRLREFVEQLFPTGYTYEFKHLFHLAWPTILIQTLQFLQQPIAVIFCGHLGKAELDAVALANSLLNVSGISIASGICTASDTLLSQTYGSKNRHKMGIILQRSLLVVLLASVPCLAIHLNTESLLLLLGQDPEVSKLTGEYMLIFIPALILVFAFYPVVKYLLNQKIVYPTLGLCVIPPLVSILLHYVLVIVYEYGTIGSAIAQACSYSTFFPITTLYIYFSKLYKETWQGWSWECLLHWGQFSRLALAGLFMVCIEWWSFEIGTFLAGLLGTTELGAQSILMQTEVIIYMIGMGIGISVNIRVGHYLGGNNPLGAKSAYRTAITMIGGANLVVGILLATLSKYFAMIFTNVPEVIELTASLMPIMGTFIFFDGISAVSCGILRGCGRQHIGAFVVFCSYLFVALPAGISLMFLTSMRLSGLWWSLAIALVINCSAYQVFLAKTDWVREAERAWERVGYKTSVSSPGSNFANFSKDSDEKTALLSNQFHNSFSEDSRPRTSSAPIPPRKTSFMYPTDPNLHTEILEKSLREDFSDISWRQLILRRLLVVTVMFCILATGIFCRLFIPVPQYGTNEANLLWNLTTNATHTSIVSETYANVTSDENLYPTLNTGIV